MSDAVAGTALVCSPINAARAGSRRKPTHLGRSKGFWKGSATNQPPGNASRPDADDSCDSLRR
jgi:hypothetical protein